MQHVTVVRDRDGAEFNTFIQSGRSVTSHKHHKLIVECSV